MRKIEEKKRGNEEARGKKQVVRAGIPQAAQGMEMNGFPGQGQGWAVQILYPSTSVPRQVLARKAGDVIRLASPPTRIDFELRVDQTPPH